METIKVVDLIGDNCSNDDDGEKLFAVINDLLSGGKSVTVDMEGVDFISLSFYNRSVGALVLQYEPSFLKEKLFFENLPGDSAALLNQAIEQAKEMKDQATR